MHPDQLTEAIELFSQILDEAQKDKSLSVTVRKAAYIVSIKMLKLLDELNKYVKGETA